MIYYYFGNTSNRVKNLLYNFETQLLLFKKLFENAKEHDIWKCNSNLQNQYLFLLEQNGLLKSNKNKVSLGSKDARVKSAPLENYGLINREKKLITAMGYELLELINRQAFKLENKLLGIDLISLFFLKASLHFSKDKKDNNLFKTYLEVFKAFDGEIKSEVFFALPLFPNFKNIQHFIKSAQNNSILSDALALDSEYSHNLQCFLKDLKENTICINYFKTAKGNKTAESIIYALKLLLNFRKTQDEKILDKILTTTEKKIERFKNQYLKHILTKTKKQEKINELKIFCNGELESFGQRFFQMIAITRLNSNLSDYYDLNRRYLSLTGIFNFSHDMVSLNMIFKIILLHNKCDEILNKIKNTHIESNHHSQDFLCNYFSDLKPILIEKNIFNIEDLKYFNIKENRNKMKMLLQNRFNREKVINILTLFKDRRNDEEIFNQVTSEATIPTIFEYIIAIAWYYIDNENIDRIFEAGLSLNSELLPKSHAIGGNADFVYTYNNHKLIIEVTLTEKTNQRRAEMESVSRHLGNHLLNMDEQKRKNSYAIFIAPHLDRNVLNDFRSRIFCYFEDDTKNIHGMKILPLDTSDLIHLLKTKQSYTAILPLFIQLLESNNFWGSRWYKNEINPSIMKLGKAHV